LMVLLIKGRYADVSPRLVGSKMIVSPAPQSHHLSDGNI
jgi:hypothetical protein